MTELFNSLIYHLGLQPDRRGECHVTCPACGKEPKRGQVHFSFNHKGGKCFCCGAGLSLRALAAHYGLQGDEHRIARVERPEPVERTGYNILEHEPERLATTYASHPETVARWRAYKPLPEDVIRRHRLGYGRLPRYSSRCPHERLIVPLFDEERVVGFRARSLECDCGRWLSPAGSQMVLYNRETLRRAAGKLLWIVENPIDALLLELRYPVGAVATLGVTMWHDEWTEWIARCGAKKVVVAYDHDVPGNGGTAEMRQRWAESHNGRVPEPGGVRLVNRLLKAGVSAMLFPWPADTPEKCDVGDIIGRVA